MRAEAAYALNKYKLVPIAIDNSAPPLRFHHIQTIEFDGWNGAGHDRRSEALACASLGPCRFGYLYQW